VREWGGRKREGRRERERERGRKREGEEREGWREKERERGREREGGREREFAPQREKMRSEPVLQLACGAAKRALFSFFIEAQPIFTHRLPQPH